MRSKTTSCACLKLTPISPLREAREAADLLGRHRPGGAEPLQAAGKSEPVDAGVVGGRSGSRCRPGPWRGRPQLLLGSGGACPMASCSAPGQDLLARAAVETVGCAGPALTGLHGFSAWHGLPSWHEGTPHSDEWSAFLGPSPPFRVTALCVSFFSQV